MQYLVKNGGINLNIFGGKNDWNNWWNWKNWIY
jgi:hypothetical protein